jgi:hypothetical protein
MEKGIKFAITVKFLSHFVLFLLNGFVIVCRIHFLNVSPCFVQSLFTPWKGNSLFTLPRGTQVPTTNNPLSKLLLAPRI